jgi:hypothetical protein
MIKFLVTLPIISTNMQPKSFLIEAHYYKVDDKGMLSMFNENNDLVASFAPYEWAAIIEEGGL